MTSLSKKRKSSSVVRDDSDVDAAVATKRGKGASGAAFIPSNKPQTDSDGNQYWEISKGRRVTISDYKGMTLVNIREYYQRDSEWLPGKKVSFFHSSRSTPLANCFKGYLVDSRAIFCTH
jgi:hypothetical protein